ncbi:GntR family transcriptional regulator [Caldovatus sediminis]|uniref:GntR family transcriptional regulator n=2 Tax=Caldovatus sediminis TaxID=2041189 RepID=A0A8J2ZDN2_9PROT|nr:GntR family transcriptional regulator [Caldovatus sediminis]
MVMDLTPAPSAAARDDGAADSPSPAARDTAAVRRLLPVQPRTMVEQAAEAVVAAAARGVFLPGDRLVEAEIARDLGISRVPVREALRLLESQGIVVSTPYKGMRLMQVTNRGVAELMRVRLALESLALRDALENGLAEESLAALRRAAEHMRHAAAQADTVAAVAADEAFHGELCRASGNATLHAVWHSLARQLTVLWGLAAPHRDLARLAREHEALVAKLAAGDGAGAEALLAAHVGWHLSFDFEAAVEQRRRQRSAA